MHGPDVLLSRNHTPGFKEDFVINAEGKTTDSFTPELKRAFKLSFSPDREQLMDDYPFVKATLLSVLADDQALRYAYPVQNITLRYLRRVFLAGDTEWNNEEEVAFLLTATMPYDPIDIDVLADAYVYCKDVLSPRSQTAYLDYLRKVYAEKVPEHERKVEVLRVGYKKSEQEWQAKARLGALKHSEQMLESMAYADTQLKLASPAGDR